MSQATLTEFEERVLAYLERSRDFGHVWVAPRTIAGAAQTGAVHVIRALDRLCALGLATEDQRLDHRSYAVTGLGQAELQRRGQLSLEIA